MDEIQLKASDVGLDLSDHARDVMFWMVMAWGQLDTMVSLFTLHAFQVPLDDGSLLLGAMETKTKFDKLKTLYEHHGMKAETKSIADLKAAHLVFVEARNLLAHSICAGHYVPDPSHIIFATGGFVKGQNGKLKARLIPLSHLENATAFAEQVAERLNVAISGLTARQSAPPLKPPSFALHRQPTPRKSGGGKRHKRRQPSPE